MLACGNLSEATRKALCTECTGLPHAATTFQRTCISPTMLNEELQGHAAVVTTPIGSSLGASLKPAHTGFKLPQTIFAVSMCAKSDP